MKNIFQSKTVWVNIIMALISIAAVISPDLLTALGIDSTKALTIIASVTAILNVFLRLITNTGIEIKSTKLPMIISFFLLSSVGFADPVVDSAVIYNNIVGAGNLIVNSVPDVNPGVSIVKVILLTIGGTITGWCIHFFGKRNAEKKKNGQSK